MNIRVRTVLAKLEKLGNKNVLLLVYKIHLFWKSLRDSKRGELAVPCFDCL